MSKVKDWFKQREGISYDEATHKLYAEEDKILLDDKVLKEYKTPSEYRKGNFKIYSRKDDDLVLAIKVGGEIMYWNIDINNDDDIFALFGKANKFPAEVATRVSKDKIIDEGDIELGIQRHGYHEYILNGNKFETKMHFRVIEVDGKKMWLTWTGYEQKPADQEGDEGIWDINTDKNSKLLIPKK